jgi:hypothetical protein
MEIMLTDQELTTLNILASFRTLVARANKINDTKISKSPTIVNTLSARSTISSWRNWLQAQGLPVQIAFTEARR